MEILLLILLIVGILLLAWYFFKRGKARKGLPVLMYHKVIAHGKPDFLCINRHMLERHFSYLKSNGYHSLTLSELEAHVTKGEALPAKSCLISFDDGYRNNYTEMYPLLKKYGLKANIFLVPDFLDPGKTSGQQHEFLRIDEIKLMSQEGSVEYGLHSVKHDSYNELSLEQIRDDIQLSRKMLDQHGIKYQSSLAYTYGAFPKHDRLKRIAMFQLFDQMGIKVAFRIGNRINPLPVTEKFLVQRLDIRGNEAFRRFRSALRTGKKLL